MKRAKSFLLKKKEENIFAITFLEKLEFSSTFEKRKITFWVCFLDEKETAYCHTEPAATPRAEEVGGTVDVIQGTPDLPATIFF